jgi:hypothetical protein
MIVPVALAWERIAFVGLASVTESVSSSSCSVSPFTTIVMVREVSPGAKLTCSVVATKSLPPTAVPAAAE